MIGQERGDLGALIRARVLAGALPNDMPRKVWAGYGSGKACSACDQIIVKALDVEYDVEMDDGRGFLAYESRSWRLTAKPTRRVSARRHRAMKLGRSSRLPCWKTAWNSDDRRRRSPRGSVSTAGDVGTASG